MIIPIRCVTCGKVLADKWEFYKKKCNELEAEYVKNTDASKESKNFTKYYDGVVRKQVLDELGLDRYCCRRHMLGHVDIIDDL